MSHFRNAAYETVAGEFDLPEYGTRFEYRVSDGTAPGQGDWGIKNGFMHEIAVCDGSVRFANVKKTVAYVCIGEDDMGVPVVEKWSIKHLWRR